MTGATGPDGPRREPPPSADEIAVTEVPESVRDELTALFSPGHGSTPDIGSPDDATTGPTDPGSVDGDATDKIPVVTGVLDLTSVAGDPLLVVGDEGEQVQVIVEQPEVVVIDADEMDRVVIVDEDRPDPTFEERQRRRARRERLRRVKWLRWTGISVGLAFIVLIVMSSPLFAIRTVRFEGAVYTSNETMAAVTGALEGNSVFTVDTNRAREILLSDPWVADVRITTRVSGMVLVDIAERRPVVWYAGPDQKARVVDSRGHVIAVLDGWPTKYLQVRGTGAGLSAGDVADPVYRAAAQLVLALPDEIRPKVLALDVNPAGELSLILKSGTIVRFGTPTDLQDKLVAVVVLLRRQDPASLAVIDVSTGEPTVQTK